MCFKHTHTHTHTHTLSLSPPPSLSRIHLFNFLKVSTIIIIYCTKMTLDTDTEIETNFQSTRPASLREVQYDEACNRIAVEAVKRGCTDNVTVMLIDILKPNS